MAKKIKDTGKALPRIDPEEVRKALGAEECREIPERFKSAYAMSQLAHGKKAHGKGK